MAATGITDSDGLHPNSIVQSLNNFARFQSRTVHATPDNERPNSSDEIARIDVQHEIAVYERFHKHENTEFSQKQVDEVLSAVSRNTASGDDDIHNLMLLHTGPILRSNIRTLINYCHTTGTVPTIWKTVKTIPLFKSGSAHDPSNYRVISLNPTLLKVMEGVMLRHIRTFVPDSKLADTQFGFRPGRATGDAIHFVLDRILRSFKQPTAKHRFLPVVFLDISKAFDRVRPTNILHAAAKRKVPGRTLKWLKSYLTGRSFYISSMSKTSDPVPAENGTPQGAILSPFLFLIFIDEIANICRKHGVTAVLFADDICLLPERWRRHFHATPKRTQRFVGVG